MVSCCAEQAYQDNVAATRAGDTVYAGYILVILLACIIPGFSLSRYVNRRISRLEQDKSKCHEVVASGCRCRAYAFCMLRLRRLPQSP